MKSGRSGYRHVVGSGFIKHCDAGIAQRVADARCRHRLFIVQLMFTIADDAEQLLVVSDSPATASTHAP